MIFIKYWVIIFRVKPEMNCRQVPISSVTERGHTFLNYLFVFISFLYLIALFLAWSTDNGANCITRAALPTARPAYYIYWTEIHHAKIFVLIFTNSSIWCDSLTVWWNLFSVQLAKSLYLSQFSIYCMDTSWAMVPWKFCSPFPHFKVKLYNNSYVVLY